MNVWAVGTIVASWAVVGTLGCTSPRASDTSAAASAEASPVTLKAAATSESSSEINPRLLRRFQSLKPAFESESNPLSVEKIDLGRRLFFETRLSKDSSVSCNSCHDLERYGVDGTRVSVGVGQQHGTRNAPSVYNAAGEFAQFWDGRAGTVEEQAKGPILNATEMAMPDAPAVVARLKSVPSYVQAFNRAFPASADPVTFDNAALAIGAFERKLVTPSRWDKYLAGDKKALTPREVGGLRTFLNVGCMVCHTGALVGGSMFERAGAVEPWPDQSDVGREAVTASPADRMMFKVPSLRNVAKTAPYFHDGSVATLDDAVRTMGKRQLGLDLSSEEVESIVAWLESLTGEIPREYASRPALASNR